jgi:branched-chain amino acid transport system substrate-binding protein
MIGKKSRYPALVAGLMLLLSMILAACGDSPTATTAARTTAATGTTAASATTAAGAGTGSGAAASTACKGEGGAAIKIGVLYPTSGSGAPTGLALKQAVDLAVDVVNNDTNLDLPMARGTGLPNLGCRKIEVVYGDTQAKAEVGLSEAERLLNQEKVVALFGAYNSAVTASASQAAERKGVPFLNAESSSPTLVTRGFKWFFRTTADDRTFAENQFQFLKDAQTKKGTSYTKVALLHENTLFGTDTAKYQNEFAIKYGFTVTADIAYDAKSTNLDGEVQKAISSGAEVLMPAGYIADGTITVQTMKKLDYAPSAIIANNGGYIEAAFVQNLGKDAEGIISRDVWSLDLAAQKPIINDLNKLYQDKSGGKNLDGNSARSFTGFLVLADAINRAGSTEPEAIRKALAATDIPGSQLIMPWAGVRFDEKGQNKEAIGLMVQIQQGKFRIVWPQSLASAELVWPYPKWNARG